MQAITIDHPGVVRPQPRHAGSDCRRQLGGQQLDGWAALIGFIMLFGTLACWLGPANDYDLRNYHLYNAHALLTGRLWLDLIPAQMQTFHPPALDSLIELLRRALNERPGWFLFLMAMPHAGCAWLAWRMLSTIVADWPGPRQVLAASTALASATGAAALPTLASPMSEAPAVFCILLACLLCWDAPSGRRLAAAGFCLGAAVGLKLTAAGAAAGIGLAWLLTDTTKRRRWRLARLLAGAAAGAALTAGWWWLWLWQRTGNPVFPYFNELFASPWLPAARIADLRFLPRSVLQAVFYPFWWALRSSQLTSELPVRDPRLAVLESVLLGLLAACAVSARLRARLLDRRAVFLIVACAVTYAAWAVQFGILRYLAGLEFLAGAVVLIGLRALAPRGRMIAGWAAPLALGGVLAVTVYPHWGRATRQNAVVEVRLPALPADTLLILLDAAPMAYVALDARPDVALVGANNNLVHPGDRSLLAGAVEARILRHVGPRFGLESPAQGNAAAEQTLRYYHLHRLPGCVPVRSNLDDDAIIACELAPDG